MSVAAPLQPRRTRLTADAYMTDGHSLYRVVTPLSWRRGNVSARLEDCQSLSVRSYPAVELWEMHRPHVRR